MFATHTIQDISFDRETMRLKIEGKLIAISLDKISSKLKGANDFQRQFFNFLLPVTAFIDRCLTKTYQ